MHDRRIGAVAQEEGGQFASFQYDDTFLRSGVEVAPIHLPLSGQPYRFENLGRASFHGLPGLLADSLPDKFGTRLIDAYLSGLGRSPGSASAVERLCYTGRRGVGALEFEPARGPAMSESTDIQIAALVRLASEVLADRKSLDVSMASGQEAQAMRDILRVGTSAGGARAKAVVAWNPETDAVRSGQAKAGPGFEHWLLKFDGVSENKDREELADPQGYGAIEYAYSLMARAAGIEMTECRLLEENGRRHFMTKRFDRIGEQKVHMLSLGAMAHFDFKQAGAYAYEQAFMTIRQLGLGTSAIEEQYRRAAFNIIARNQDDHVKNIAFLMDRSGQWSLSPAFDLAYSYNPSGDWTAHHQMSLNGKVDDFTLDDLRSGAERAILMRRRAQEIVQEVLDAVSAWPDFAAKAGVFTHHVDSVRDNLRLSLPAS